MAVARTELHSCCVYWCTYYVVVGAWLVRWWAAAVARVVYISALACCDGVTYDNEDIVYKGRPAAGYSVQCDQQVRLQDCAAVRALTTQLNCAVKMGLSCGHPAVYDIA